MISLTNTESLRLVTTSANAVDVTAFWADNTTTAFTPNNTPMGIAAATTTTIVSAPAAATQRNVSALVVRAKGGANTVTLQLFNGTAFEMVSVAMLSGECLIYENGASFKLYDSAMQLKQTIAAAAGTIALTSLAAIAANTVVANATAGAASPTAVALAVQEILGRKAGNIQAITAGVDETLRRSGAGDVQFGTLVTNNIGANQVTNSRAAQMNARTCKGNNTNAAADPIDLTADQTRETFAGGCLTLTTAQTATASTTNLTAGTYTIPANMAQAGSEYDFAAWLYTGRGATVTATNVIIELLVNAAVVRTVTLAINVAPTINRQIRVEGKLTVRTTGAGGTMLVSLRTLDDCVAAAAGTAAMTLDPAPSATSPATTALDTTVTRSLELRARLSAATATCYLHMTHCTIGKGR